MDKVTHVVVGETFEDNQVQEARELYEKPTVTEQWVLTSAKLGKLAPVKPYDPITNGKLFSSCIFTMYQIDQPDRLKLYAMITLHGGTVQKELDNKVTHLLSGGSQSVALKVAALTKNKLTIVTPDWVLECLRHKKLADPDAFHPNLLISPVPQGSKTTLMPSGVREEKPSMMRTQLQQNVRPSRPVMQTMQHTPQQINEIIQSQIQQQQMQEKAKQRAAAASSNPNSQSPITTLTHEPVIQSQVMSQIVAQKVVAPQQQPQQQQQQQQILGGNTQVSISTNPSSNQQIPGSQPVNPHQLPQNNQIQMQRQISLQQIEANARNQKIQMISQQLQQSTQNQQQLLAQQQFKQFQNNQMMSNNTPQQQQQQLISGGLPSHIAQNVPQQFTPVSQQPVNVQQQAQQGQPVAVQHPQQFAGQQMKQVITPNQQPQNQQFIMNQNVSAGTVKAIGQQQQGGGNAGGNNYIQIIQQGQQIIQIQQPEGGQIQQKVLSQHVSAKTKTFSFQLI